MADKAFQAASGFQLSGDAASRGFDVHLEAVDELATELERRGDTISPSEAERLRREIWRRHRIDHFLKPTRWQRENPWEYIYQEHFPTYWKQKSTATVKGIAWRYYWLRGCTRDDILNMGRWGLWQAWLTYDPENEEGA